MTKHRRAVSVLLTLVFLLLLLAGCGSGQDETSGQEGDDSPAEVTPGSDIDPDSFFSSAGIADNGYWEGVTALDHVELVDYRGIVVPSEVNTISDAAVQGEVSGLLAGFTTEQPVLDRAVEDGDSVNIDYVGSVDGVEFEGGTTGGAGTVVTIGVTSYIDDFLEQLIGHMPGETFNVEVTFPEDYGVDDLNGKDAVFVTTVNYILETVEPELNDAFVADNLYSEGWSTVEEMRRGIRDDMQRSAVLNYIQEYLMDNVTFKSVPDPVLRYLEASMVDYYQSGADYYGVEIGEILSMYEGVSTVEELLERYHDGNVNQANYYVLIQAIAEDAQIAVSDEDVDSYFQNNVGIDDYSEYESEFGMPYIRQVVLNQMVLDFLESNAVLE